MTGVQTCALPILDGIESLGNVTVIAATNRPDMIDPALLRPGRFDKMVLVGKPDLKSRLKILEIHTKNMPLIGIDLIDIASKTDGFVGADLAALCREAGMIAYRKDRKAEFVNETHFTEAMKTVKPSVDSETFKSYENIGKEMRKRKDGWDGIPFYG